MRKFLPLLAVALGLSSCTTPKTIEGQKVIGTRFVDGKVVYLVEGSKEVMQRTAADMKSTTGAMKIAPLPPAAAASPAAAK